MGGNSELSRSNDCYSRTEGGGCPLARSPTPWIDEASGELLPGRTPMAAMHRRGAQVQVAVHVQNAAHAATVVRAAARSWVRGHELSIALVSDREIRTLNRRWR